MKNPNYRNKLMLLQLFILLTPGMIAQNFSTIANSGKALSFKDMQLQFAQFKKTTNLLTQKNWKVFKRFESDMQLHTDTKGEPANFGPYLSEAIRVAIAKENSQSSGAIWNPIGPEININNDFFGIGRVNCVAFHPSDTNIFYVGVAQGGVWKTTNCGQSYTPLTDNLPITRISDICLDPNNPNTIYISVCDYEYIGKGLFYDGRKRQTHYGLGIYKSTDAGLHWMATGLSFQLNQRDVTLMKRIIVNPNNSNQVLACGVSGMYLSSDGGTSWVKKLDSLFCDMEQDPINKNIIYAATAWIKNSQTGDAAIYKSSDFGQTWSMLNTGIPFKNSVQRIKLAISPSDPNYVYAVACDNSEGLDGIYVSTNGGISWRKKISQSNILSWTGGSSSGGQGTYDLALIVDEFSKEKIFVGGIGLWGSLDSGSTFNSVCDIVNGSNNSVHVDMHQLIRQHGSHKIFLCNDGGIYKCSTIQIRSSNCYANWSNLSQGMQCTSFYRVSSANNVQDRIMAGAQDNSSFYFDGNYWHGIFGGDGMDNYLDPINHQVIIGSSQYGTFYYSNDDGASGIVVGTNPNAESAEWTTPLIADQNHPGVLYIGNENIVKSSDGGQSWTPLASIYSNSNNATNTEISAMAISNTNSNVICAVRRVRYEFGIMGVVIKTINGGLSFTKITSNLPDSLFYTGIDINPSNSNEIVVSMAGFANNCKVFKTINGGLSWFNISYNLPNIPMNCVKYIPNTNQLMVASDLGVYNLVENIWVLNSSGLPNVIVTDIEFNTKSDKVYLSTFGRGLWESTISSAYIVGVKATTGYHPNFNIFPSVNSGEFSIDIGQTNAPVICTIFDVNGKVACAKTLVEKNTSFNLNLLSGCYYIKIQCPNNTVVVKKMVVL